MPVVRRRTDKLSNLESGLTLIVVHPAFRDSETQAVGSSGDDANVRMAVHRDIVTNAITSGRIKGIIAEKGIKLMGYADSFQD